MFYPITSRAVRRRKDELGAFGRIDAGGPSWTKQPDFAA
jgi:hypothetical protein